MNFTGQPSLEDLKLLSDMLTHSEDMGRQRETELKSTLLDDLSEDTNKSIQPRTKESDTRSHSTSEDSTEKGSSFSFAKASPNSWTLM